MDFLTQSNLIFSLGKSWSSPQKGEIFKLPQEATALDFAYAIHTTIGNHSIGAKVNHRLVPISYRLSSGDQVEILTSKTQEPTEEWLAFVTTAKAKSKVDSYLRKKRREIAVLGQQQVEDLIGNEEISPNVTNMDKLSGSTLGLVRERSFSTLSEVEVLPYPILKKVVEQHIRQQ